MASTRQVNLRVDEDLLAAIDARCKVKGLTRTQWLSRAARHVLTQQGIVIPEKKVTL